MVALENMWRRAKKQTYPQGGVGSNPGYPQKFLGIPWGYPGKAKEYLKFKKVEKSQKFKKTL